MKHQAPRILHLLSQRPLLTGSGVTLDALVRHADAAGYRQQVVVGLPAGEVAVSMGGGVAAVKVDPLCFGEGKQPVDFPVPGMSDVMPYESTRFSAMSPGQIEAYRRSWCRHLERVIQRFRPALIHSHHIWLLSSFLKQIAPEIPVMVHCHATGLRQMVLCPHLADQVRAGCAGHEAFGVLHEGHSRALIEELGVDPRRVHVVGAGYREDLFYWRSPMDRKPLRLLYVGKYSFAKGLPWLLDAFESSRRNRPDLELHIAGSGSGEQAESLEQRMRRLAPAVTLHGQLDQPRLAELMRSAAVTVLPSFYEGVPLVLVEALACGNRLVSTALPGVTGQLLPHLREALELVPLPPMAGIDTPSPEGLPEFRNNLEAALAAALDKPAIKDPARTFGRSLEPFTWSAVFRRVERVWRELRAARGFFGVPE